MIFSSNTDGKSSARGVAIAVGSVFVAAVALRTLRKLFPKKKKHRGGRKRATSIGTTTFMVSGIVEPEVPYAIGINVLVGFDRALDVEQLKALFADKMIKYRNFRCVPEQKKVGGPVIWREVKYNPENHFFFHTVKDVEEMKALVQKEVNSTVNFRKQKGVPWWGLRFYGTEEGKYSFLLIEMDHALGDGVSLTQAFGDILTKADGTSMNLTEAFSPKLRSALKAQKSFSVRLKRFLRFPLTVVETLVATVAVLTWALGRYDTHTAFHKCKDSPPIGKVPIYLPSRDLSLMKNIKARLNAQVKATSPITINDIEFALFAGTIRRYTESRGDNGNKCYLRALTPLAIPELPDPETRFETLLRNYWCLMSTRLPVECPTPLERVITANKRWTYIKQSMIVPMAFTLHAMAAKTPLGGRRETSTRLHNRHSVIFSNVPGPAENTYLAGSKIVSTHVFAPNQPVHIGTLSFGGYLHSNFCDDGPASAEREAEFGRHFTDELVDLAGAVGIDKETVVSQMHPAFAL